MPEGLTRPTVSLFPAEDRAEASAAALNLTTSSIGSINMSVDIDGTTYAGEALGALREAAAWQLVELPAACLSTFPGWLFCVGSGLQRKKQFWMRRDRRLLTG